MYPHTVEVRKRLERHLTVVMVGLSFVFLLLLGTIIHRIEQPDIQEIEISLVLGALVILWSVFFVELIIHFLLRDRQQPFWKNNRYALLACFIPPLRIGARCSLMDNQVWIPFVGWKECGRRLSKDMERLFSVPMIVIALMILPLLALEYGHWEWAKAIREHPGVQAVIYYGTIVIWFAFAVEFIIMVSIADKKLRYCAVHWLDIAIILLPMVAFLRSGRILRLGRLARLQQVSQMTRLYRLRGLSMKAWRAFLLLDLMQRITGQSAEKRLKHLRDLLAAKEFEVEDLRKEIEELETAVAAKQAKQEAVEAGTNTSVEDRPVAS